jgi:hypothetical protein
MRRGEAQWLRLAAACVAMIAFSPRSQAASCAAEIDLLARQYALSTDLSEPEPHSGAAEPVLPQDAQGPPPIGSTPLPASKRRQMQVLLNGARASHQQGKDAECFQRLSDARAIPEPG